MLVLLVQTQPFQMLQEELNRVSVPSFSCLVNRIYFVYGLDENGYHLLSFRIPLRIMQLDDQNFMSIILHYSE